MDGFVGVNDAASSYAANDCRQGLISDLKTKGNVRPPRSRMTTTTRRLPVW